MLFTLQYIQSTYGNEAAKTACNESHDCVRSLEATYLDISTSSDYSSSAPPSHIEVIEVSVLIAFRVTHSTGQPIRTELI